MQNRKEEQDSCSFPILKAEADLREIKRSKSLISSELVHLGPRPLPLIKEHFKGLKRATFMSSKVPRKHLILSFL